MLVTLKVWWLCFVNDLCSKHPEYRYGGFFGCAACRTNRKLKRKMKVFERHDRYNKERQDARYKVEALNAKRTPPGVS